MRNLIFAVLLMIPLAGCQSTSVEQDPTGKTLPLGTISALNVAFHQDTLPYVRSVSIWRFEKIPDLAGIGATGAYIPFTKTVLVGDDATYPDRTLIHEMLHVIFFWGQYPFPELFAQDLERFLKDEDYTAIVSSIERSLKDYRDSPTFPEAFMDDEYYCYIGSRLYAQDQGGELGLPEYMARHYRGVLNSLLFYDRRAYKGKIHPNAKRVRAEFQTGGRTFIVTDTLLKIKSLVRYGGIVRRKNEIGGGELVVSSVGGALEPELGEYQVRPGVEPSSVAVQFDASSYKFQSTSRVAFIALEVLDRDTFLFKLEGCSYEQLLQNKVFMSLSWQQTEQLFDIYLQKRLGIRVRLGFATQARRN